jgi:hypothetical protein
VPLGGGGQLRINGATPHQAGPGDFSLGTGERVFSAGDQNGDGRGDVLVGHPAPITTGSRTPGN